MAGYDTDFILWASEQVTLLRAGRLAELDRINVAKELDTLARAMQRELSERLVRLLQNLLQWGYLLFVRLPAWYIVIQEERNAIPRLHRRCPHCRKRSGRNLCRRLDLVPAELKENQ